MILSPPAPVSVDRHSAGVTRRFVRYLWLGVLVLNLFVMALAARAVYSSWRGDVLRAWTATQNLSLTLDREIGGIFDHVDLALKGLVDQHTDAHRSNLFRAGGWNTALKRQRAHLPTLTGIRGADASGALVYGMDKTDPQAASVADREYFAVHRDHPDAGLLISSPVFSRVTQKWALILSRGLKDGNGKFAGVVAAAVPIERFSERFASLNIGAGGSITMRDGDLHLIVRLPASGDARAATGATRISNEFAAALQRSRGSGSYHNSDFSVDGVQRFHSYRRNGTYPFYINVGVADDQYLESWRSELLWTGAFVCLFLLVTVAFARILQRAWSRQEAASAQLSRKEADFRVLSDAAPFGVALLNADATFAYLNPAFNKMFGYALEDIPDLAAWWEKAYPDPEYRQKLSNAWRRSVAEALSPGTIEGFSRVCCSNGVQSDIRFMVVKMDDHRVTITCEDVTARKQAEAALRESRERFTKVVEHSPLSMALVCMDGTIEYINRKAIDMFGYEHQDIANMDNWWALAYPDASYRAEVIALWMGLAAEAHAHNREIEQREYRVTCKDGKVKIVAIFGVWIADKVLVIFDDITGRKKNEEGMQLARQIFDTASEAIFISDLQGNVLDVNPEACRLAKYTHEQMLGLRNADILAQEDVPRIAPDLGQYDAGGGVQSRWLLLCSDGSTVPLDLVVQRLPGDRYLALGRDLRERERVLGQLASALEGAQAANLAKSRFLAAASHDLRQPLQAINLFCIALANSALTEEQRQISDYLLLSAKTLGDLLNALLDISRFDAGAVRVDTQAVQTGALFRNISAEFSPLASEKGLRLTLRLPRREAVVLTDAKLLRSLMGNLVGNAIKYTERGGILIGIRRRDRQALIQVWDSGIGIAPEHAASIFEEYFQIGNLERDRTKGLGLGLSIARRLAKLLGTQVVLRSRVGKGSVFEIRLPLADETPGEGRVDQMHVGSAAVSRLSGRRIVVIEDDAPVVHAIKLSLESLGMRVTAHASAEAALADPEIADADFYISDLRLPGLDGKEFLDILQQRSRKPIKALLLTGDTSRERIALAQASAWPVHFKPIDLTTLLSTMEAQDAMH